MTSQALAEQAFRLQSSGDAAGAEKLYAQALQGMRNNPALWFNHGLVLRELDRHAEALKNFEQVLALLPPMAQAQAAEVESERGATLMALNRFEEALAALDRAVAMKPGYAGALANRGRALRELKRLDDALASYDMALRFNPRFPLALTGRGLVLAELGRLADALTAHSQALALNPRDTQALNNRGRAFMAMDRPDEALKDYAAGLAIAPKLSPLRFNHATALAALGRVPEAHAEFQRLAQDDPDYPFLFSSLLDTAQRTCDFALAEKLKAQIPAHVAAGKPLVPFNLLLACDDPALQRRGAANYVREKVGKPPLRHAAQAGRHARPRIGYLSYDFRYHTVASSNAAVLERHDRDAFECFAFATCADDNSAMRKRLESGFEHFIYVSGKSDADIAKVIADAGIDILVDLGGHTVGARPGVLARRPAAIQVGWQGYPGTLGSSFMDYLLADAIVIPPEQERHYAEKVLRLPHCYMPFDPTRPVAEKLGRQDAGLPENGLVFCAFNSCWKVIPNVLAVWLELLSEVPSSLLWLRADNDAAVKSLQGAAAAQGIAPERLVFAPRADEDVHLGRHRLADIFLDTFPYSGHSTAIDALWTGLPLVAMAGQSFASLVSASALNAVGMPELAVTSLADYKALALRLAQDEALRGDYRKRLAAQRSTSSLFDATIQVRALEDAYRRMLSGPRPS
jgi:predicted O-linked N-acetylglucosamine transferase (SPINDLY family)